MKTGTNLGDVIKHNATILAATTIFEWLKDMDLKFRIGRRAVRQAKWQRDRAIMEKLSAQRQAEAAIAKAMQLKKSHKSPRPMLDAAERLSFEAEMLQDDVMAAVRWLRQLRG